MRGTAGTQGESSVSWKSTALGDSPRCNCPLERKWVFTAGRVACGLPGAGGFHVRFHSVLVHIEQRPCEFVDGQSLENLIELVGHDLKPNYLVLLTYCFIRDSGNDLLLMMIEMCTKLKVSILIFGSTGHLASSEL